MNDLITPAEAAHILGLPLSTLNMDRRLNRLGIPFYRLGRRVKYSRKALNRWLASQLCNEGVGNE